MWYEIYSFKLKWSSFLSQHCMQVFEKTNEEEKRYIWQLSLSFYPFKLHLHIFKGPLATGNC